MINAAAGGTQMSENMASYMGIGLCGGITLSVALGIQIGWGIALGLLIGVVIGGMKQKKA